MPVGRRRLVVRLVLWNGAPCERRKTKNPNGLSLGTLSNKDLRLTDEKKLGKPECLLRIVHYPLPVINNTDSVIERSKNAPQIVTVAPEAGTSPTMFGWSACCSCWEVVIWPCAKLRLPGARHKNTSSQCAARWKNKLLGENTVFGKNVILLLASFIRCIAVCFRCRTA